MGNVYGYARVSSHDQRLNRQLDALAKFGVKREMVYSDRASGKDFERPAYRKLLETIQEGDTIAIKSIDRLGRNYEEILEQWRLLTKIRKVAVVVLDMPLLNTQSPCDGLTNMLISDIVLQLLSYIAQVERESIKRRQAEGIAAAQLRGVRFGRPKKTRPSFYDQIKKSYLKGCLTRKEAASKLGISVSTFDR